MPGVILQRLSLGGTYLLASWVPVAAQSASAEVVCVGSEPTPESSSSVPRVVTEDVTDSKRQGWIP